MIIYFSGTGNSRYAAEQIAAFTGDSLYDASASIRSGTADTLTDTSPFVFVAPVYVSAPPLECLAYLERSRFLGNRKVYFLMTCAGGMGASPDYCRKMAEKKNMAYMGTASVVMPQNYIAFFTTKTPMENRKILTDAQSVLKTLAGNIAAEQPFPDPNLKAWETISTKMILKPYYKWFITTKKFTVTEACIGCGKCEKVCPLGNIRMDHKQPKWSDRCTHCMACINLCPRDAIEYGKATIGKIRYRGPEQVLKETAATGGSID